MTRDSDVDTDEAVGALMRRWRVVADLTQEEAAALAGVGQSAWSRVETGKRTLSLSEALAFAQGLGLDVLTLTRDPWDVLQALLNDEPLRPASDG